MFNSLIRKYKKLKKLDKDCERLESALVSADELLTDAIHKRNKLIGEYYWLRQKYNEDALLKTNHELEAKLISHKITKAKLCENLDNARDELLCLDTVESQFDTEIESLRHDLENTIEQRQALKENASEVKHKRHFAYRSPNNLSLNSCL